MSLGHQDVASVAAGALRLAVHRAGCPGGARAVGALTGVQGASAVARPRRRSAVLRSTQRAEERTGPHGGQRNNRWCSGAASWRWGASGNVKHSPGSFGCAEVLGHRHVPVPVVAGVAAARPVIAARARRVGRAVVHAPNFAVYEHFPGSTAAAAITKHEPITSPIRLLLVPGGIPAIPRTASVTSSPLIPPLAPKASKS